MPTPSACSSSQGAALITSQRRERRAARVDRCAIGHVLTRAIDPLAVGAGAAEIAGCGRRLRFARHQTSRVRAEPGRLGSMLMLLKLGVADLAPHRTSAPGLARPGPGSASFGAGAS